MYVVCVAGRHGSTPAMVHVPGRSASLRKGEKVHSSVRAELTSHQYRVKPLNRHIDICTCTVLSLAFYMYIIISVMLL